MNPSVLGFSSITKAPALFHPFLPTFVGGGGVATVLKGRGDNWSWLIWCADNTVIRRNHIKGTLLGQQGPSSYRQDIGNTHWFQSEHAAKNNKQSFQ